MRYPSTILLCFAFVCSAFGETNKNQYWLLNPTPRELMRPMTTDGIGPRIVHTPYTVDSGHVQFEGGFVYGHERWETYREYVDLMGTNHVIDHSYTFDALHYVPALRIGLWNRFDWKVSAHYYDVNIKYKEKQPWPREDEYDFIDGLSVPMSLKVNVWGNDGGRIAFAVEPWVRFRIRSRLPFYDRAGDAFGLNLPFQWKLTDATDLQLMSGVEIYNDRWYDFTEFVETAQFRHKMTGKFDAFAGFTAYVTEDGSWVGLAGTGMAYRFSPNAEFQIGADFDVQKQFGDRFHLNSALSARF